MDRDWTDFSARKDYTYQEHTETRRLNRNGGVEHSESQTREVLMLAGRPYEKLIARDGKPLSERGAAKEQRKLDQELVRRQNESAADRAKAEKARSEDRRFIHELPNAFDFRLEGTETVSGQPVWVIRAEPRPGFKPANKQAKMFQKVRARIWIEQQTYHWVKADADVLETLSFGLGLVRIAKGATVHFEQTHVNNEIWLPAIAQVRGEASLALVKRVRAEIDVKYSGYQKFQSESRMTGFSESQ